MKIKNSSAYTIICIVAIVVFAIVIIAQFIVINSLNKKKQDLKEKNEYLEDLLDNENLSNIEYDFENYVAKIKIK
ncbi:MAG: hypothetical protein IJ008_00010 [Clostridia bacterium]|nr:hypothetical protein [Clostridia bacterium]